MLGHSVSNPVVMQQLFDGTDGPQSGAVPRPNPKSKPPYQRKHSAITGFVFAMLAFLTFPARFWLGITLLEPTGVNLWIVTILVGLLAFLVLEVGRYLLETITT